MEERENLREMFPFKKSVYKEKEEKRAERGWKSQRERKHLRSLYYSYITLLTKEEEEMRPSCLACYRWFFHYHVMAMSRWFPSYVIYLLQVRVWCLPCIS